MKHQQHIKGRSRPCCARRNGRLREQKSVYIAFNYDTVQGNFGDDEPEHDRVLIQAHLYALTGLNVFGKIRTIKKALSAAGMTWPSYVNASEKDGQHHIFECEATQKTGDR